MKNVGMSLFVGNHEMLLKVDVFFRADTNY